MQAYIGIVHKDPDRAWGIHFPDVPGCFSAADELDDLPREASEALALHLEDMEAPEPRPMSEIRAVAEDDLAEGAFLLAVPVIRLSGRMTRANISIDAGLLSSIDDVAKERGLTRSAFLADLARREIVG